MLSISSAQLIDQAATLVTSASREMAAVLDHTVPSDWTNLQAAENDLAAALVKVRIAKIGVLRRDPSFDVPELARVDADAGRGVVESLDDTTRQLDTRSGLVRAGLVDPHKYAVRQARLAAERADAEWRRFRSMNGTPGTISGEKMTREMIREYDRLAEVAQAAQDGYMELAHNTQ
jgi:hypothetical protein